MLRKVFLTAFIIVLIPTIINYLFYVPEKTFKEYTIKVKQVSHDKIVELNLEDYVVGVLAGEMFKSKSTKIDENNNSEYDVVDTTKNQVYLDDEYLRDKWGKNYEKYIEKIRKVVSETSHEYIFFEDKIIDAMFFSTSVGMTENSEEIFPNELPYLRSVSSTWDEDVSPVFKENYKFTLKKFYELLGLKYNSKLTITKTSVTSTGRVKEIKINGKTFTGKKIQQLLDLRSNYFSIAKVGDNVQIETKGYGHGVGMSQYGANGMAKEGYKYEDIIKHYYQDVEIKKI